MVLEIKTATKNATNTRWQPRVNKLFRHRETDILGQRNSFYR